MSGGKSKKDPYYQKDPPKKTKAQKSKRHSKAAKEKMRQRALDRWRDPEFRKKMSDAYRRRNYTDEGRKKLADKMKKQWQNPAYRDKISKSMKQVMRDPEQRRIRRERSREAWKNPELRELKRKQSREQWKDKSYREKVVRGVRRAVKDETWRRAHSEALKRRWQDPEYREKQLGLLRKGLKERGLVGRRAPRRRRRRLERAFDKIRERDGGLCRSCGTSSDSDSSHPVHHIVPRRDGGPDEDWNLLTLCHSCHRKADARSGFMKIPLDSSKSEIVNHREIQEKWLNYLFGDPT